MAYVLVLLVASAAGIAVAATTLRAGRAAIANPETWTEPYREGEATDEPDTAPKPRLPSAPTPRSRAIGAAGLLLTVLVAAGAIAFVSFLGWTMLKRVFS